jgi:hypothetical protein
VACWNWIHKQRILIKIVSPCITPLSKVQWICLQSLWRMRYCFSLSLMMVARVQNIPALVMKRSHHPQHDVTVRDNPNVVYQIGITICLHSFEKIHNVKRFLHLFAPIGNSDMFNLPWSWRQWGLHDQSIDLPCWSFPTLRQHASGRFHSETVKIMVRADSNISFYFPLPRGRETTLASEIVLKSRQMTYASVSYPSRYQPTGRRN